MYPSGRELYRDCPEGSKKACMITACAHVLGRCGRAHQFVRRALKMRHFDLWVDRPCQPCSATCPGRLQNIPWLVWKIAFANVPKMGKCQRYVSLIITTPPLCVVPRTCHDAGRSMRSGLDPRQPC